MLYAVLLPLILFASQINLSSQIDWGKIESDSAKFKAKIPGFYKTERTQKDKRLDIKYTTKLQGITYMISVAIHEIPLMDEKNLAKISLYAFADKVGVDTATIVSKTVKTKIGHAQESMLNKGTWLIHYRVYIYGNKQYQIIVFGESRHYRSDIAEKFMKYFKIKK